MKPAAFAAMLMLCASVARAEVVRVDVAKRVDVGTSGYEKIVGTIHFAVDPKNPRNRLVVDLDKAPVNAAGLVEFSSDLYILRPKTTSGNGVALMDVLNRGNKMAVNGFNRGGSPDPATESVIKPAPPPPTPPRIRNRPNLSPVNPTASPQPSRSTNGQ